jgi:hypothetical protein
MGRFHAERHRSRSARPTRVVRSPALGQRAVQHVAPIHASVPGRAQVARYSGSAGCVLDGIEVVRGMNTDSARKVPTDARRATRTS